MGYVQMVYPIIKGGRLIALVIYYLIGHQKETKKKKRALFYWRMHHPSVGSVISRDNFSLNIFFFFFISCGKNDSP